MFALPVGFNKSSHSPVTIVNNKLFLLSKLPLYGSFLFIAPLYVETVLCENPSMEAVS